MNYVHIVVQSSASKELNNRLLHNTFDEYEAEHSSQFNLFG